MSGVPVPKPRVHQDKKPVPLPRRMIEKQSTSTEHTNTFSRTVKSLSSTSKQISEEISGKVQETKRAVIESTRQSLRKLTRKTSASIEPEAGEKKRTDCSEVFTSIRFQSPLTVENDLYEKNEWRKSDSDESVDLPPPNHPPPALPDESLYDQPAKKENLSTEMYEAVYPAFSTPIIPENVSRSSSWAFYDPVTLSEAMYSNIEASNRSSASSSSEMATVYENYISELRSKNNKSPQRATQSTIFEFDPLSTSMNKDMVMLEQLLEGDLYGNIGMQASNNYDQWSFSGDSESDEYLNPPTPPERFDSLADDPRSDNDRKSQFYVSLDKVPQPENKKSLMKHLNNILKKVPESAIKLKTGLQKEKYLDRPILNIRSIVHNKGILFKISSKSVEDLFGEFHFRWCVLAKGHLTLYSDNSCENIKEQFPLDSILSIYLASKKYKFEMDMYCLEVTVSGQKRGNHVLGTSSMPDCKLWMQKMAEALTNRFPMNIVSDYKRMGWAYLKEGVSSGWLGAWVILTKRHLYYAKDDLPMGTADLRKARCILLQDADLDSPKTSDKGPNLIVDCPNGALYLRMWTARETKIWCHFIQREAYDNGDTLDQQQLTKDDVPVIIEKCINFIYAHGSMSDGIYRHSGRLSVIAELLIQFKSNAWATTLTIDKCTEHDVANVLKRFLRNLPEPILSVDKSDVLCKISDAFLNTSEKIKLYKNILEQFPTVTYCTLRKVLGHLFFIQSQSSNNRMPADNLSLIWAPTLMGDKEKDDRRSATECNLVIQLIMLYRQLFPTTAEELEQEKLMLKVLERHNRAAHGQGPAHIKASGDLRVGIYLGNKSGDTVIITISPQKLAADVCMELSNKMGIPAYDLQLEEVVLNDCLRRPIHYSEKVLEVVLRWSYWDEPDRKDNCLVLTTLTKYMQFDKHKASTPLSEELKFADNKTKHFKPYTFKFEQTKLSCYKDKMANIKIYEWNIKDIFWYFGHEVKRNLQNKWSFTFILRKESPNRSRATPFFGHTVSGNELTSRLNWISAMIQAEYINGLSPPLASTS